MSDINEPQENKPEDTESQEYLPEDTESQEHKAEDTEPQHKQMRSAGKQIMAIGVIIAGIFVLLGGGLILSKFLG